jgi:hypothetical protein
MDDYSTPKKMKKLGDLFGKYKTHFKPPQATIEKAFVDAVRASTGYEIEISKVRYTLPTKTISLSIPSLLKTELKLKQVVIIKELKKQLGEKEAPKTII